MPKLDYGPWNGRNPSEAELSSVEQDRLSSAGLWMYDRLRARKRSPLSMREAYQCALAKTLNDADEAERCLAHQTGAV